MGMRTRRPQSESPATFPPVDHCCWALPAPACPHLQGTGPHPECLHLLKDNPHTLTLSSDRGERGTPCLTPTRLRKMQVLWCGPLQVQRGLPLTLKVKTQPLLQGTSPSSTASLTSRNTEDRLFSVLLLWYFCGLNLSKNILLACS